MAAKDKARLKRMIAIKTASRSLAVLGRPASILTLTQGLDVNRRGKSLIHLTLEGGVLRRLFTVVGSLRAGSPFIVGTCDILIFINNVPKGELNIKIVLEPFHGE